MIDGSSASPEFNYIALGGNKDGLELHGGRVIKTRESTVVQRNLAVHTSKISTKLTCNMLLKSP